MRIRDRRRRLLDDVAVRRLGARFESGPNALNFLRLLLALEVVAWHSYALLPADHPHAAIWGDLGVDGFFAISGFLIVRSWQRSTPARYVLARARRILPGLAVCLLVVAFVYAPMVGSPELRSQVGFVAGGLHFGSQWGIAGSLSPWNGSLWSLRYEVACYGIVAALGMLRLLRPAVVAVLAVLLLAVTVNLHASGVPYEVNYLWLSMRCGLLFSLGGAAWMYRGRVPLDWRLAAGAVVLLAGSSQLSDYRPLGAVPLTYLLLWAGVTLGRFPRLVLRNDLSYGTYVYAFPTQQLLIAKGVTVVWPLFFGLSALCVLPIAAASWFLVERVALGRSGGRVLSSDRGPAESSAVETDLVESPVPRLNAV